MTAAPVREKKLPTRSDNNSFASQQGECRTGDPRISRVEPPGAVSKRTLMLSSVNGLSRIRMGRPGLGVEYRQLGGALPAVHQTEGGGRWATLRRRETGARLGTRSRTSQDCCEKQP